MKERKLKTDWCWYKGCVRVSRNGYGQPKSTQHLLPGVANLLTDRTADRTLCGIRMDSWYNGYKRRMCKTCKKIADSTYGKRRHAGLKVVTP